jgi:hypothetical protein
MTQAVHNGICAATCSEAVRHERDMQGGKNWIFPKEKCKPVLLRLSLARNLVKPLLSLYGIEWRERGYGLRANSHKRNYFPYGLQTGFRPMRDSGKAGLHKNSVSHWSDLHTVHNGILVAIAAQELTQFRQVNVHSRRN